MGHEDGISELHYEIIREIVHTGACPSNAVLARRLNSPISEVERNLRVLADCHGIVLHPYALRPWVVHPFSLTPTLHWVEGNQRSWWAPCIWCALGVATIVSGRVNIHTRVGAEQEEVTISVQDGQPISAQELVVHFAIPPAQAWRNMHEHCSMVLPFRLPSDIPAWCARHGLPNGQAVPLLQVSKLAQRWYGLYLSRDWHKWSISEARQIFKEVGLTSNFWALEEQDGRF